MVILVLLIMLLAPSEMMSWGAWWLLFIVAIIDA